jgi:HMG box factor, other
MNPPSTPNTPILPSAQTSTARSSYADLAPSLGRGVHGVKEAASRLSSPVKSHGESDRKAHHWDTTDENGVAMLDFKRRKLTTSGFHRGSRGDISPGMESYAVPSQRTYASRSGLAHLREHYHVLPPLRPHRSAEDGRLHDSLTLPPLQTTSPTLQNRRDVEATVMTIPFINKIKVLAKISPPLVTRPTSSDSPARGAVIAVDGQDSSLVHIMVKYLGGLLTKEGRYAVRVFEGPEIHLRQKPSQAGEMGDATMDYLNIISEWHRISGEIVQFVSQPSKNVETKAADDSSLDVSPTPTTPKTSEAQISQADSSNDRGDQKSESSLNPIPIALVPRYQLTTADLFACAIPINDSYAPLDHWQWMASLWRACVGPDATVYIRECGEEEVERHGGGNPVEVRLHDARTIVVRKTQSSPKEIEEKALRRVGFEIEEYLAR